MPLDLDGTRGDYLLLRLRSRENKLLAHDRSYREMVSSQPDPGWSFCVVTRDWILFWPFSARAPAVDRFQRSWQPQAPSRAFCNISRPFSSS